MDVLITLKRIAEQLNAHGMRASVEYPGFLSVDTHPDAPDRNISWQIGDANAHWSGNWSDGQEQFETDVPSTSHDVDAITAALLEKMRGKVTP